MHLLVDLGLFLFCFQRNKAKMSSQIEFSMNLSFKFTAAKTHVTIMSLVLYLFPHTKSVVWAKGIYRVQDLMLAS